MFLVPPSEPSFLFHERLKGSISGKVAEEFSQSASYYELSVNLTGFTSLDEKCTYRSLFEISHSLSWTPAERAEGHTLKLPRGSLV